MTKQLSLFSAKKAKPKKAKKAKEPKRTFDFEYDGDSYQDNEGEYTIYMNDNKDRRKGSSLQGVDIVGTIYKQTGWSGSSYTVTTYRVDLDGTGLLDPDDFTEEEWKKLTLFGLGKDRFDLNKDFDVKGHWAGMRGYGGSFSHRRGYETSRKALAAAKAWVKLVFVRYGEDFQ
jgi:hypothetical protein